MCGSKITNSCFNSQCAIEHAIIRNLKIMLRVLNQSLIIDNRPLNIDELVYPVNLYPIP